MIAITMCVGKLQSLLTMKPLEVIFIFLIIAGK